MATMKSRVTTENGERFQIRYESLFRPGTGMSFPCDRGGRVDIDTLSPRSRCNYLFARAMVGREFNHPAIVDGA
jgi:hypothetical protein